MTPKLSDLDIPEIKSAAAEWALVSSQIEKITLHRFKPGRISTQGPFYAIIIWVSPEVDVDIVPWMEPLEDPDGKLTKAKVREQYKNQEGLLDREKAHKHPLYGLWNLAWELSAQESKEREGFHSFYRDGFECSDPRFDWLVLLLNIGDEYVFEHGEIYDDLDATEVGSAVLFSRKAIAPQDDGTTTLTPEFAKQHRKPWIHIDLGTTPYPDAARMIREWIRNNGIKVMNVAGARGSKDPMICQAVTELLEATLSEPLYP